MKKIILILLFLFITSTVYATSITLQEGASSYSGTSDTELYEDGGGAGAGATTNYGTNSDLLFWCTSSTYERNPIIKFDVSSIPSGSTINSAVLYLFDQTDNGYSGTWSLYRVFKPWTEGEATWKRWDNANSKEWGTQGCHNASDAGSDNTGDGTDYDRTSTAIATLSKAAWDNYTRAFRQFTITNAVQNWVDGTWSNNGVYLVGAGNSCDNTLSSSENATSANRPKLIIDYTEGASSRRIMIVQ